MRLSSHDTVYFLPAPALQRVGRNLERNERPASTLAGLVCLDRISLCCGLDLVPYAIIGLTPQDGAMERKRGSVKGRANCEIFRLLMLYPSKVIVKL